MNIVATLPIILLWLNDLRHTFWKKSGCRPHIDYVNCLAEAPWILHCSIFNLQDNQQDKRRNPFYPSLRYGLAPHAILELPQRIPPVDARSADTVRENNPCVASTYAGRTRRMCRRF